MTPAPIPENETERLQALQRYDVLDSVAEAEFDDIAELAAQICAAPIALVSLVDAQRQWFKSRVGLAATETPRDVSFCGHAIHEQDIFEIPNALEDERFRDNPLVIADPGIRFYAGAPLTTPDGYRVGTLCVIDRVPRRLTAGQRNALARLGRQVVTLMELRLSRHRLTRQAAFEQSILRCADSAVIATDTEGVITHFNPAAERMLGYTAAETIGKLTPAAFHDPAEIGARADELSRELGGPVAPGFEVFVTRARAGVPDTREWTYVRQDGWRLPVLLSVSALRDHAGQLTGFLGIARDIAERRQAEAMLRLEQQRLSGVIEGTNVGTWEWNVETGETVFNERWAEIVGYTLAELAPVNIGTWLSLAHPDDLARSSELLGRHFAGALPYYDCECRMRHKAGHWVWVQDRGRVIRWTPDGRPLMMYGTHTDIAARKAAEDELRDRKAHLEQVVAERTAELAASERRFRATFENAAAGIAHVGKDGRFLRFNQQFCDLTGYAPAELAGMSFEAITHPDDLAVDLAQAGQLFRGGIDSYTMEKRYVRKDGSIAWINLLASVVRDDAGDIEYGVAVISDITESVRMRAALGESERFVRASLDALSSQIAVLDESAKIIAVNAAWTRFAEENSLADPVAGIGVDYLEVCDRAAAASPAAAQMAELLRDILAGRRTEGSCEYPCHSAQEERWFFCRATRFPGPGPVRVALAHENVSPLKLAQRRAEASQRQFRDLFEFAPDAMVMADGEGKIRLVNRQVEQIFGWTREELIGRPVEALIPPAQSSEHAALRDEFMRTACQRAMAKGLRSLSGLRKDGSLVPVEISLSPLELDEGMMVAAAVRDVSERMETQEALRLQNETLTAVAEAQAAYLERADWKSASYRLLHYALDQTRSEYGFIGVLVDGPKLRVLAHDGIVWDALKGREFYEQAARLYQEQGYLEFNSFETLFGAAVLTGDVVLTNAPSSDRRSTGRPEGHPPMHCFLGVPIVKSGQVTGLIALANRPGGYTPKDAERIGLIVQHAAILCDSYLSTLREAQLRSEREAAEREIRQAQATLDATDDAAFVFDPDTLRFTYVNEGAARQVGYAREQLLRMTPLDIAPEFDEMRLRRLLGQMLRGETGTQVFTTLYRRQDAHELPVEIHLQLVSAGEKPRFIAMVRDISERLRQEADRAARAVAEQANKAKSIFLATVSHEIRTPMYGIIGSVDLLEQSKLGRNEAELVETIRDSAFSLLTVIDDILDFSKIEAGRLELERESLSLEAVVESACNALKPLAVRKGVQLSLFTDPYLPPSILGDSVRLRQILNNLLSNAIKFSSGQARQGKVAVRAEPAGDSQVRFTVADNGIGMSAEVQARLFTPFVQAEASTTRRFGGTGLGLSICQRLVELFGGRIEIESAPGQGSTFSVILPIERSGEAPPASASTDLGGVHCLIVAQESDGDRPADIADAIPSPDRASAIARGRLILVAEDNEVNRRIIRHQLAQLGFAADVVANGREALEAWRDGRHPLLLTDLHMPEMDGYELTRTIRGEEGGAGRMPIIAFSANALRKEAERCRNVGMDDYVSKPIVLETLQAMLKKWLPAQAFEPVSASPRAAALDESVLAGLIGDDKDLIADFLTDYCRSAEQARLQMLQALAAADWAAAASVAHRLKSSSRSVGARSLADCCERIEHAGWAGVIGTPLREEFETELSAVLAAIHKSTNDHE